MSSQPFSGSRLKIQRANRHLYELDVILKEFSQTNFCKLRIDIDPHTGGNLLHLESIAALPPEIPLVIGDIAHNLRCSLDYVTTQIVGKNIDRITFPMGAKRDDLVTSQTLRNIQKALPDFADFILNQIQPYQGGQFLAWEISSLDNFDKHRLLIPTLKVVGLTGVNFEDENRNTWTGVTLLVGEGERLQAVHNPAKMKINSYGQPAVNIFFAEGSVFQDQPVIPTLLQCSQFLLKAIEALEHFCFGDVPDPVP